MHLCVNNKHVIINLIEEFRKRKYILFVFMYEIHASFSLANYFEGGNVD